MNKKELARYLISEWYKEEPKAFDSPTNSTWLLIYMKRWLGGQTNFFAIKRMEKLPYETFRREGQGMISDGSLPISQKNKFLRHRKEVKVRQEVKKIVTQEQVWGIDSMGKREFLGYRTITH